MYKVIFQYEDGTEDEIFTDSISEAYEYESDPDFYCIETI